MANAWISHVQNYQASHPGMSYKQCMTEARGSYVKGGKQTGQTGGILPLIAGIGSAVLTADELSQPISKAVLSAGNVKRGSKQEFDTKLIAKQGIIASIPAMIAEDNKRRARQQRKK